MKKAIFMGLAFLLLACLVKAEEFDMGNCILYDLDGNTVKLSDFKGKPLVLWFWTTWCPYCRHAASELNNIYPELKLSGIELIGINVDEHREKIIKFLKSYPMDFKVLQDRDADCAFLFGVIGVPTYVLIDRNGKLQFKQNYFPGEEYKQLLLK